MEFFLITDRDILIKTLEGHHDCIWKLEVISNFFLFIIAIIIIFSGSSVQYSSTFLLRRWHVQALEFSGTFR
jgi:hypothetical protein